MNRTSSPSYSASSTLSSSSSSSPISLNNKSDDSTIHDVIIVYPNGFQTVKKIDCK
jgi:hypothetical protein